MDFFDAVILGLLQGITEFLPLSSVGHAILLDSLFEVEPVQQLAYGAFFNFAAAAAVILYFSADLLTIIQAVLRKLGRLPVNNRELIIFKALVAGAIPAVGFGFFLEPLLQTYDTMTTLVAIMMLLGSFFLMYVEWQYYVRPIQEPISKRRGLLVGVFYLASLLPGVSTTGATIGGGMFVGMSRYEAARFAFLLMIPITLGAGARQFVELLRTDGGVNWSAVLLGSAVAALATLCSVASFLAFIKRHSLWSFIWYGVVISGLVGYVSLIAS